MGRAKPMKLPMEQHTKYVEWRPSDTPDLQAVRNMPDIPESLPPSAQAEIDKQLRSGSQMLATDYLSALPEASRRIAAGRGDVGNTMQYGAQMSDAAKNALQNNFLRRLALAQMTIGRPLTSQTTGFTSAPTESIWKTIVQGLGTAASGAVSGPAGQRMFGGGGGSTGAATSAPSNSYYYG